MVMVVLVDTVGVPSLIHQQIPDVRLTGNFVVKYERKCSVGLSVIPNCADDDSQ